MPTDVLQAIKRRHARERRSFWRDNAAIITVSIIGAASTIVRALQSESFVAALTTLGAMD